MIQRRFAWPPQKDDRQIVKCSIFVTLMGSRAKGGAAETPEAHTGNSQVPPLAPLLHSHQGPVITWSSAQKERTKQSKQNKINCCFGFLSSLSLELIFIMFFPQLQTYTLLTPLLCCGSVQIFHLYPKQNSRLIFALPTSDETAQLNTGTDRWTFYSRSPPPPSGPQKSGRSFEVRTFSLRSPNFKEG